MKWGWIEHNAAVNASPPTLRRKEIEPPSITELREILAAADAYDSSFGVLIRLATATGMRRGELCGLRWSDVDLEGRHLHVVRSVAAVAHGTTVKSTRTRATRRLSLDVATVRLL